MAGQLVSDAGAEAFLCRNLFPKGDGIRPDRVFRFAAGPAQTLGAGQGKAGGICRRTDWADEQGTGYGQIRPFLAAFIPSGGAAV